ncbi:hypothetical protein E2C01_033946 [Portunus trituberculatus]|uniref:Uncharacterized protein n=1 Tax=Portunus trituberculatus TaxID=210409 RepID=A0A5B7F527_PORTR|nr:hypothetical protein [Portunus trituberculatus]
MTLLTERRPCEVIFEDCKQFHALPRRSPSATLRDGPLIRAFSVPAASLHNRAYRGVLQLLPESKSREHAAVPTRPRPPVTTATLLHAGRRERHLRRRNHHHHHDLPSSHGPQTYEKLEVSRCLSREETPVTRGGCRVPLLLRCYLIPAKHADLTLPFPLPPERCRGSARPDKCEEVGCQRAARRRHSPAEGRLAAPPPPVHR